MQCKNFEKFQHNLWVYSIGLAIVAASLSYNKHYITTYHCIFNLKFNKYLIISFLSDLTLVTQ